MKRYSVWLGLLLLGGCPAKSVPVASYPAQTTMKYAASARCPNGRCSCRGLDDESAAEEGVPAGHKRFEVRLPQSHSAIWVEIAGHGVHYKPPAELQASCFYVDLPTGEHAITVHTAHPHAELGLQAGLTIFEYGSKAGPGWYRSVHFVCGGLGHCTRDELATWVGFQRRQYRGVLDPCGSVMVRGVTFGGSRETTKSDAYLDLTVRMKMKVYDFEPYQPPKTANCKGPTKNQ
jgi:hypothetical protein